MVTCIADAPPSNAANEFATASPRSLCACISSSIPGTFSLTILNTSFALNGVNIPTVSAILTRSAPAS